MWAEDDRPREKMQLKGKTALSDAELLAIIIGSGTRQKSAVDLAKEILKKNNHNLYQLGKMNQAELMHFSGIGQAKAISIMATLELGRRRNKAEIPKIKKLNSSNDAYLYVKSDFQDLEHEEFRVIGLSQHNHVIKNILVSKGGTAGTVVDGKMVFKALLDMKATNCILFHNHPSGVLRPSQQDRRLTKELIAFGKMIRLQILDHIIVGDTGFYSFADEGEF